MITLRTDRLNFPIVTTAAELEQARIDGHPNVKAPCPVCLREKLVATGAAGAMLIDGCGSCQAELLKSISIGPKLVKP